MLFSFFSRFNRTPARRIRKARPRTRRFVLEPLEDRSLPSSGVTAAAAAAVYGQMPLAFEINQAPRHRLHCAWSERRPRSERTRGHHSR
jgi:hypothetical protein